MPLARIGRTVLFFVHVPKTGGTSVEAYLRAKGSVALHGQGADWARVPLQHLHRAAWEEIMPRGAYDQGFAILRDPMARLMSEYRMRAAPAGGKLRPLGWMRAARGRVTGRPAHGVRVGGRVEILDFDAWAARVIGDWRRDPWILSNHVRPQADFVGEDHRLFRLEDGLDPVFRWIDAVTGTGPAEGVFHERRSPPLPLVAGQATEALVREVYAEDYALLARIGEGRG